MRSTLRTHWALPTLVAVCVLTLFVSRPSSASGFPAKPPKPPKVHTAVLGGKLRVTWIPSTTTDPTAPVATSPTTRPPSRLSITIRPLLIDGRRKEWTTGPAHEVTDHTFAVLQALHINDALPTDKSPHFVWQTGTWLLVDRAAGHVTPLRITAFDPTLSGISWYRDLAAYCAVSPSGKTLSAEVFEIGTRKAAARKRIAAWPLPAPPQGTGDPSADSVANSPDNSPAVRPRPRVPSAAAIQQQQDTGLPHPTLCTSFEWQRDPTRVVITPRADLPAVSLDLSASSSQTPSPESGSGRTKRSREDEDSPAASAATAGSAAQSAPDPAPGAAPAKELPPESAPDATEPATHSQPRS
jgi:hypothetical protein